MFGQILDPRPTRWRVGISSTSKFSPRFALPLRLLSSQWGFFQLRCTPPHQLHFLACQGQPAVLIFFFSFFIVAETWAPRQLQSDQQRLQQQLRECQAPSTLTKEMSQAQAEVDRWVHYCFPRLPMSHFSLCPRIKKLRGRRQKRTSCSAS